MRSETRHVFGLLVSVIVVALAGAVSLHGQEKKRVITWPPYAVVIIRATGPGAKPSPVSDAVELVSLEAAGHPIKAGQSFAADDDWLGTLTVKFKNISGQAISGAQISFTLPETLAPDQGALGITLRYGTASSVKQPNVAATVVAADEVFELKLTAAEYEQEKTRILQRGLPTGVLKLWIATTMVRFEDGTHWSNACLKSSDPANACP